VKNFIAWTTLALTTCVGFGSASAQGSMVDYWARRVGSDVSAAESVAIDLQNSRLSDHSRRMRAIDLESALDDIRHSQRMLQIELDSERNERRYR
jgi:hypothetical protein